MAKKNVLIIDKHNLDEEWCLQADRYHEAALDLAQARTELSEAEDALELIEAKVDKDFRAFPENYGFTKATDAAAKSAVVIDDRVQEAKARVREAKDSVAKLWAFVIALDHKKTGLPDVVALEGRNYFASPREHKNSTTDMTERSRQAVFNRRKE